MCKSVKYIENIGFKVFLEQILDFWVSIILNLEYKHINYITIAL